ncbi:MAG: VWA domain-containing protein [Gammaproteobacteria bacterium]|nr:VWA domain-containing protein [Gammaproteobacteria bacterium]MCP5299179.1 VWA domain-containing protein [Chromatiaceae bacterium]
MLTACNQLAEQPSDATRSPPTAHGTAPESAPSPTAVSPLADLILEKRQVAVGASLAAPALQRLAGGPADRERYAEIVRNGVQSVAESPVSTFSIDVDTGSYTNVRRMLQEGRLPPHDAVRVEEMINYFGYADPAPATRDTPFRVSAALAPTPWNHDTQLLRIALKAWDAPVAELPASNLVFLIDVSGSMNSADKLPLLKRSIKLLTRRLRAEDRISLVVYAGAAGVVLEPTAGDLHATIEAALDELGAGGSTHGSAGIRLAYAKAREGFIRGGINRVILATDGDFNVGTVDDRALVDLIEEQRRTGIALTTLGFGRGNLNEAMMERLADHGDGNYAYIDSLLEAQKVLVEQVGGTLLTVAGDVKIQVEFNPARVVEYRLIGYENRALRREDFNNDAVDAGELGAGHSVVALYELALTGGAGARLDPLRYTQRESDGATRHAHELAFIRLRYKMPDAANSRELRIALTEAMRVARLDAASTDFRFAAAVAAFGQRLSGSPYLGGFGFDDILALAGPARGVDDQGYRADFIRLVRLARSLELQGPDVGQAPANADDRNG